ncbi:RcnB family protein [Comamonas endophytica]|uniref:RcnB family protein n=1 Tax=Comamonas endophytica TaxID=2949090 RepID=A0ABY6G6P5_9BURK|nr:MULTISPECIES: RcnB family protein [unclassified Acidovorax]MCD2511171.1 RcnB family protein [Acidovorax sp. D4N7]UYG50571.1 RcnB family protein [Acidovorax sp. 5MLIR]
MTHNNSLHSAAWKAAAAAVALTLGLGATVAQAQPDHRRGPPGHSQGHGPDRHDRFDRHDRNDHRGPPPHAHGRHGAGPNHDWVRGSRVPPHYRTRHYVVQDWRGHRLSAPPRGYQWVQNGADYLLVAIATGVIAQIILGN